MQKKKNKQDNTEVSKAPKIPRRNNFFKGELFVPWGKMIEKLQLRHG